MAAGCASVVVCRASPSQKAAVVRMMMQYEVAAAEAGARTRVGRWMRRYRRRMNSKMLAIGDGAPLLQGGSADRYACGFSRRFESLYHVRVVFCNEQTQNQRVTLEPPNTNEDLNMPSCALCTSSTCISWQL